MSKIQKSLIANILLQKDFEKKNEIISQLFPDFFDDKNKEIFKRLQEKIKEGVAIDPLGVWDEDYEYITECMTYSGMINSLKGAFLELKNEYEKKELKEVGQLKDPIKIKSKLVEIEEKSELLDPQEIPTLYEVLE